MISSLALLLKTSTEADFLIIGKTAPIFRGPEAEGSLCGVGSALREVKLNALSRATRVSFRTFYKLIVLIKVTGHKTIETFKDHGYIT